MTTSTPPSAPGGLPWVRLAPGFGVRLGRGMGLALVGVYLALAALLLQQAPGLDRYAIKTDYVTTMTGAEIVLAGQPAQLYDRTAQAAVQPRLLRAVGYGAAPLVPFIHAPFELALVVPFRALGLSYGASFAVWTAVNLLALLGALLALRWGWPLGPRLDGIGALGVLTFFPLYEALLTGQTAAFLILGWALGGAALRRRYDGWAGVGLAFALVKPQMLLLVLLVLLALRRWRALAGLDPGASGGRPAPLAVGTLGRAGLGGGAGDAVRAGAPARHRPDDHRPLDGRHRGLADLEYSAPPGAPARHRGGARYGIMNPCFSLRKSDDDHQSGHYPPGNSPL